MLEGFPLWLRQVRAILGLELRRMLWGRRAFILYLLAFMPVVMLAMFNVLNLIADATPDELQEIGGVTFYTGIFEFILRGTLFLGCVLQFSSLVRGEITDRSLHYYFLSPIRREVFIMGKFISAWISTTLIFAFSAFASWILVHLIFGLDHLVDYSFGIGTAHIMGYLGVLALSCLGYGAVFLAVGMLLKNPIVPAAIIWLLEQANPFLPAGMKKFSIIHYLNSLLPVAPADFALSVIAEKTPWWIALTGFLIFSGAVLAFSSWRARALQIEYGAD